MANDIFDVSELPQVFATRAATARKAASNVLVEAEEVIEEVSVADDALAFTRQQNAGAVENIFDDIDAIQGNVERIAGNPLSELFGLFNPDFNIGTQQAKLSREQLKLKRVEQRSRSAEAAHSLTVQGAARELELAETRANIAQKDLGNLTTEINVRLQARNAQMAERDRTLAGMTVEQINAAMTDPTELNKLDLDIRPGDLRTAKQTKEKAALAAENLQMQMQQLRGKVSDEQAARMSARVNDLLQIMPEEGLLSMAAQAKETGGIFSVDKPLQLQPGIVLPAGVKIGLSQITATIAEKQDAETAQAKVRAEQAGAELNAQGILTVAENGLLAAQGQLTGEPPAGGLDITAFPTEHQAAIIKARNLINASASAENEDAVQMQIMAASTLSAVQEKIKTQLIATAPKDVVPAMTEFLTSGQIQSSDNAAEVLSATFLNTNAFSSNPILSTVLQGLSLEALKIKEGESQGIDLFGTGFPTGKQKKLDNQAFTAQTIANYTASFASEQNPAGIAPINIIAGEAAINYTAQVMGSLSRFHEEAGTANPWEGFVANGKWTGLVRGGDGFVADQDIVREIQIRDQALREQGLLKEGDPSLYTIFQAELQNPTLRANYISQNLTPTTHEEAAMYQAVAGNRQVAAFDQRLALFNGIAQQLDQIIAQDPEALKSPKFSAAIQGPEVIRNLLINQQDILSGIIGGGK
jgi:hypothetical protein